MNTQTRSSTDRNRKSAFVRWFAASSLVVVVAVAVVLILASPPARTATGPVRSAMERLSGNRYFSQPLVWLGASAPREEESQLLLEVLDQWQASRGQVGEAELEQFLETLTNSAWAPSLRANLALYYRGRGEVTRPLAHWQSAWEATGDSPDGNAKRVADFALAHWTRLLASLGRFETLDSLVRENRGRILDRGPWSQMWARTREAVAEMRQRPGISYQCGTFALGIVARELGIRYDVRALADLPSPATGFSMKMLSDLSEELRLGLVPVMRVTGEDIPVPSVVHWKQDHYGAIVGRHGEFYKVVDPTFGHPQFMSADTINSEVSGHFLVTANQILPNYRLLAASETSVIFGRGNPNYLNDWDDQCNGGGGAGGSGGAAGGGGSSGGGKSGCFTGTCGPGGGGFGGGWGTGGNGTGCESCTEGMPIWEVSDPYVNLWLYDEPLGSSSALGPRVSFKMSYKQRAETYNGSFSSVGLNWNCSWLSYVEPLYYYQSNGFSRVHYPGGGIGLFIFPGDRTASNYFNTLRLHVPNTTGAAESFEVRYSDGSKDVYGFAPTNAYGAFQGGFFLSQKVAPEGHMTSFYYEDYDPNAINIRLKYVVDPDGRTNTLYYATNGYSENLITQVTDPFGRSTYLQHDEDGLLTNITDVAGLSSSFGYNELGWVTNLTTPYGTTSFAPIDKGILYPGSYIRDRSLEITEAANNSKQLYAFVQDCSGFETNAYPSSEVPTNTPIDTLDNAPNYRNSYHWGRQQYTLLSTNDVDSFTEADYRLARMRHWLGATEEGYGKSMDTLSLQREASPDGTSEGQKTWYDYPNKGSYGVADKGDHISPGVVAQVLPDGSTWYTWYRRNTWQMPTNVVSTYTTENGTIGLRTNIFVYASNGIDLVRHINPSGEQVLSNYFGNAYHQPDASYDALNQETRYTYNANRQLTSIRTPAGLTTTNLYYTSGDDADRLSKTIDLEISRTNSFTYYANGLVYSHTDERGLTTTNYWDNLQRLTGLKYPDGTTRSNLYTALDITAMKDRLGYWTYRGFDAVRRVLAETNVNSVVTRYGYCECGALSYLTNAWNTPVQEVTGFTYDYQGNPTVIFYPDSTITNWYDSLGRLITTGDALGSQWFGYNNQGLRTSITNGYAEVVMQRTVYDIEDRSIYVTDANGVTVTNYYDDLDRLVARQHPDTGIEDWGYTANVSGPTSYTNQLGKVWRYVYDPADRKTFETNANSEVIRYTYSPASDLKTLIDGKNQVTTWNYTIYGQVSNKIDQASSEILRYAYDADSRLTNRWSKAKGDTGYAYDPVGNLTNINYPSGTTDLSFGYDALNRVTNMVDAAGTTKYEYYAGGRLKTEDGPWSSDTVTNLYNSAGLRTNLVLLQPTGTWTNGFAYDAAKRLTSVASKAGSFAYTYHATRGLLPIKVALPNTSYITNDYDSVARLLFTKLNNSSHTTLNKHEYLYNAGNQRTQQVFNAGSTYGYTYDNIGQLKIADSATASEDRGYVYDAAWNLNYRTNNTTPTTFTVNNKNELTNVGGQGFSYDGNGNLTNFVAAYTTVATYDAENQLATFEETYNRRSVFTYDGRGRLRQRQDYLWAGTPYFYWYLEATVRYVYDGMRVIQERNDSNTPQVSYTRGNDLSGGLEGAGGIGGLLARSHGYSGGNWSTHNFYHADGGGNVTYLVNSSQTLAASYRYDPYGNTISSSGTLASANVYRFSSKEIIPTGNLYYYGYRFYDPNLQRWLSRDPVDELGFDLLPDGGSSVLGNDFNLYVFVHNNPLTKLDRFGLESSYQFEPIPIPIPDFPANPIPVCADGQRRTRVGLHACIIRITLAPYCPRGLGRFLPIPYVETGTQVCKFDEVCFGGTWKIRRVYGCGKCS